MTDWSAFPDYDPQTGNAYLTFENVSKWFGQVIALNDVTVSLPPGVTGLLGPNGAGKSTFLKLATGLIRPKKGRVRLMGQDPWNNPPLMARIGLAPEHDAFYDWMTGREFVTTLVRVSGFDAATSSRLAVKALERVAMTEHMDRRIGTYSKGMRQRTKIAQALVHNPHILFLDEPLTGTDPVGRRDLVQLIRDLGKQGLHLVVSSHILHEIEAMTQNILLIAKGRIVAEGDIHQIRALMDEHPHNVEIRADKPRVLAQALLAHEDVVTVRFQPDQSLLVETRDPDKFYGRLPSDVARSRVRIEALTSPDDNLQAVFKYLVG